MALTTKPVEYDEHGHPIPPEHAGEQGPPEHAQNDKEKPPKKAEPKNVDPMRSADDRGPQQTSGMQEPRRSKGSREGEASPTDEPLYSPNIPKEVPPEKQWELYAFEAAKSVYPRLHFTEDYAIGRRTVDGPMELLDQREGVEIDFAKIQEEAQKLADANAPPAETPSAYHSPRVDEPGYVKERSF